MRKFSGLSSFLIHAAASVCGLSFFLFALSLPGIGRGVWPQSEDAVIALHTLSGLLSLCLILLWFLRPRLITIAARQPAVLFAAGLGLWSLVIAPFMPLPVRHILGSPQTGEGAIWWFDMAILIIGFMVLLRFPRSRRSLIIAASAGFAICFFLHLARRFYPEASYIPYDFTDYMVWSAIPLFTALICVWRPLPMPMRAAMVAGFLFLIYVLDNQSATLFCFAGLPFLAVCAYVFTRQNVAAKIRSLFYTGINIAIPLGVMGIVCALMTLAGNGYEAFSRWHFLWTFISRVYLAEMGLGALMSEPWRFITGNGWGSYTEHVVQYVPLDWVDLNRTDRTQWDGLSWDHFHAHNVFFETLTSAGIIGLLLVLLFWASAPFFARRSRMLPAAIFSAAGVSVGSFWFIFPLSVPFIALGYAIMLRPVRIFARMPRMVIPALLLLAFVLQGYGAAQNALIAMRYHAFDKAPLANQGPPPCTVYTDDGSAGGIHMARILTGYLRQFVDMAGDKTAAKDLPRDLPRLHDVFCQASLYSHHHDYGLRLAVAIISARGETLLTLRPYLSPEQIAMYENGWQEDLIAFLARAPRRSDMAVPYLSYYLLRGKEAQITAVTDYLLKVNQVDPVGLWFSGIVMAGKKGQKQTGIERMRIAIAGGVGRYMKIDPAIEAMLDPAAQEEEEETAPQPIP